MSDYISLEAMSEKPKCPGCGADMKLMYLLCNSTFYYACAKCGWDSPVGIDSESAFRMAMRRVEPINRVLTLEESRNAEKDAFGNVMRWLEIHDIRKYAEFNHLENESGIFAASLWFDEETGEAAKLALFSSAISSTVFLRQKEYGLCWRCWLRKPTKEEMEGTPWEK